MLLLLFGGAKTSVTPSKGYSGPVTVLGPGGYPRPPYGAFNKAATTAKPVHGWMPEWGFRHDPEDLERRLKAQRESAFSPKWLDRFIAAEAKARTRIGKVKTAAHRAALEEAVEQVGARVGEAIDAGSVAPEELIIALEAAAAATRAAASLKHALRAIEMAHAILMEEEDIEILLLH